MTSDFRILEYEHIISTDDNVMEQKEKDMKQKESEIEQQMSLYSKASLDEEDKNLFESFKSNFNEYLKIH